MLHVIKKPARTMCLDTYVIRDKNCIGYCCDNPLSLESKLRIAEEAGYSAVELWHKDVSRFIQLKGVGYLLGVLEKYNLQVSSYKVVGGWFEGDNDLSVLETASQINSKCCVFKFISDEYKGPKQEMSWYKDRYLTLLDKCEKLKVKPAVEFMALAPFMNRITDVYDLLSGIKHPYASLVLDTWHLWRFDDKEFSNFSSTVHRLRPEWIGVVHFTDTSATIPQHQQLDGDRKLPTLGCLNLNKFCNLISHCNAVYSLNTYDRSLWDQDPLSVATKGFSYMSQCFLGNKSLGDSPGWKNKQKERCDGLWNKQYYSHLDPRVASSNREKQLEDILKPYLLGKVVLDVKCGYSPLAKYVSYGFDAHQGCIDYLRKKYPHAQWTCTSDAEFADGFTSQIDVLLHIGIGDSDTEGNSHMILREKCKPKLVVIECAAHENGEVIEKATSPENGNVARWQRLKKDLTNVQEFVIHTDMQERSHRLLLIGHVKN